ncbi:exodeoxyribonuclease V subunit gamma [Mariniluteicoccus flavus]
MSLQVHHAARADELAARLAAQLAAPLGDPFATEVVSVPSPGVERWLSQTLSHHLGATGGADGVCAGVDFPRLDTLLRRVVDEACTIDPDTDPWHPARGVWSLLAVLDACADEAWMAPARAAAKGPHRWVTAREAFRRFRAYAAQRPEMLAAWSAGRDVGADGGPLDPSAAWQAELWRRLTASVDVPDPATRVRRAAVRLQADPGAIDLPERLAVFGPTRLATEQITVLRALATGRDVSVWLPHPSPALWATVERAEPGGYAGPRRDDPTATLPHHRINRRLGRDARELQLALGSPAAAAPATMAYGPGVLGRLQRAIATDGAEAEATPLDPSDDSVRFHASHGPDRQVEVLREVVLGLLADDPTLEPRDIVVLCPDIETHAPLLSAVFALDGVADEAAHPGQRLRVRLADRSLRQLNPLLGTLSRLIDLARGRAGASELLDLCADAPVARRFGFSDRDLERLHELIPASGIRWGLDPAFRERWHMQGFAQNTWAAGLDRLLTGVALDESGLHHTGGVLPLEAVDSSDVDLVGRLAELVERVRGVLASFARPQPLAAWTTACRDALDSLTSVPNAESWQVAHAWSELAALAASAGFGDADVDVSLSDLRSVLRDAFAGRASRANFRTGALTVCTMTPMRSVPHRVVIVLGPDDGVFPRANRSDGDDLLAGDPWVGDRDPRSEDRQLLLDAVMAAREKFIVVLQGFSSQSGERRPPSIPVAELRDAVADLCDGDPWPVLEHSHPLQPYAATDFTGERPFSFDPIALEAARSAIGVREARPGPYALAAPLSPLPEFSGETIPVDLDDLVRFYQHPAKALLRRRGQLYVSDDNVEPTLADELPVELDGLQKWAIGDRMLRLHLSGVPLVDLRDAELVRGDLPPHAWGLAQLTDIGRQVKAIADKAQPWLAEPPSSTWVSTAVGPYRLTGLVSGVRGTTVTQVSFSRESGRDRITAWIRLLALRASQPHVDWRAITIGRGGYGHRLGPVAQSDAPALLKDLLDLYATGLRQLLPLPPKTSAEQAYAADRDIPSQTAKTWRFEHDPAWGCFLPDQIDALERFGGGRRAPLSFESLALRVWQPILHREGNLR